MTHVSIIYKEWSMLYALTHIEPLTVNTTSSSHFLSLFTSDYINHNANGLDHY